VANQMPLTHRWIEMGEAMKRKAKLFKAEISVDAHLQLTV